MRKRKQELDDDLLDGAGSVAKLTGTYMSCIASDNNIDLVDLSQYSFVWKEVGGLGISIEREMDRASIIQQFKRKGKKVDYCVPYQPEDDG